jgi:hypothetical protein
MIDIFLEISKKKLRHGWLANIVLLFHFVNFFKIERNRNHLRFFVK